MAALALVFMYVCPKSRCACLDMYCKQPNLPVVGVP